jgi:PKD repeat protein
MIQMVERRMALPGNKRRIKKTVIPSWLREYIPLLITICLLFPVILPAYAHPNGTETIITTDTVEILDSNPAIYGDFIVYLENDNTLMLYNIASGETTPLPVTDPRAYYPAQPALADDTAIWQEYDGSGAGKVVRYNIPGRTIKDSFDAADDTMDSVYPKTDGTTLVWQNYNITNSDWDIAAVRDGSSDPELILYSTYNEKHPSVYGNFVVYENWTDSDHVHIWRFNLTDNTSFPVAAISDQETLPQISAERIVWQAQNNTDTKSHIEVWENGVTTRLSPPGINQKNPSLYGDHIAVEDYRRDNIIPDVYIYHYTSAWTETWVAPNNLAASQKTPAVWNNRIVWEDTRSGNSCGGRDSDIYLFTLGSSDICPVADFSLSENAGPDPLTVTFTDRSSGSPLLYRIWNYSNGPVSYPLDPAGQTFSGPGIYHARLTVGNLKCRNVTTGAAKYDIYVDTPPDADFIAAPREGFSPLAVQFTDISGGDPSSWTWDFGDGSISHEQNPLHTYTTAGRTYTISLTVNNSYAGRVTDKKTKTDYIRTFLGATGSATIPIEGITVIPRYGGQFLLYNATFLPDMATPVPTILTTFHPGIAGWQNVTFLASDTHGFSDTFGNNTYMGNVSRISFQTGDVTATGVSSAIGTGWGVNYHLETLHYLSPASISTEIWENTIPADKDKFRLVITGSNFVENVNGIAYTAHIVKSGINMNGDAIINMSVDRSWLGGKEAETYVIGFGTNNQGNTVGSVIPADYLFNDGTLDYFEADVPEYYTTFGLSPLSGSGNPLQLITLSVTSHVNPPAQSSNPPSEADSDSQAAGGAGAGKTAIVTAAPTPAPAQALPDPGKSAKVYTNANGVVTQVIRLLSTDSRAAISIGEGVVARDASGKPLPEISVKVQPSENLPAIPSGSAFTFAGMAYEIGPDGATFSPPITLTFTLPQAQWGQDYTVKSFDQTSGTWQELPASFDTATGIVTVQVSHLCCFALFTVPHASLVTPTATPVPVPSVSQVKSQPPTTAVSIFMSMIGRVASLMMNNIVIIVAVIILIVILSLYRQGRFPGLGR